MIKKQFLCCPEKYGLLLFFTDCPQCYDLVQEQVNIHRGKLRELTALINNIGNNPSLFNDSEFLAVLGQVNDSVNVLLDEARGASSELVFSHAIAPKLVDDWFRVWVK